MHSCAPPHQTRRCVLPTTFRARSFHNFEESLIALFCVRKRPRSASGLARSRPARVPPQGIASKDHPRSERFIQTTYLRKWRKPC